MVNLTEIEGHEPGSSGKPGFFQKLGNVLSNAINFKIPSPPDERTNSTATIELNNGLSSEGIDIHEQSNKISNKAKHHDDILSPNIKIDTSHEASSIPNDKKEIDPDQQGCKRHDDIILDLPIPNDFETGKLPNAILPEQQLKETPLALKTNITTYTGIDLLKSGNTATTHQNQQNTSPQRPATLSFEIINEVNTEENPRKVGTKGQRNTESQQTEQNLHTTEVNQSIEQDTKFTSRNTTVYRERNNDKTESSSASSNVPLNETFDTNTVQPIDTPQEPEINTEQLGALFARLHTSQLTNQRQEIPEIIVSPPSPTRIDCVVEIEDDNI